MQEMSNTTSEIYLDRALQVSFTVWHVCDLLCTMLGIPGHLFLICITTNRTNRKEPTSIYFTAIAICELIFLLGLFWLWCVGMSWIKFDPREVFSCGIFYSILMGPTILSNLYLASMSIDGILMILSPPCYRRFVSRRQILRRIIVILLIIIVVMIPHHYYYYYDEQTTICICDFHTFVQPWRIRIWPYLHAILFVSIPSLITFISSIILLHNRRHHRRALSSSESANARRLERNSILIVFISLAIFFSTCPAVILQIFIVHDHLYYHKSIPSIRWKTYRLLLNCFLALAAVNYSMKFYLRFSISKLFRRDFRHLFACCNQQKADNRTHRALNTAAER